MKVAWWIIALSFVIQSGIGLVFTLWVIDKTATEAVAQVYETQEVFCKECCWKTEQFYTCTKKKDDLFRKIP